MSEILETKEYLFLSYYWKIIWYFNPAGFREGHAWVLSKADHCLKAAI